MKVKSMREGGDEILLEESEMMDEKILSRNDDDDNCEKNYCEKSDYKRQRSDDNNLRDKK